jgi:hypothetical protein
MEWTETGAGFGIGPHTGPDHGHTNSANKMMALLSSNKYARVKILDGFGLLSQPRSIAWLTRA